MDTRKRIAYEALKLFSIKGFSAVSVRDIAGAVGIKESSLYNHYKNKQHIFDSIIEENCRRAESIFSEIMPGYEDRGGDTLIDAEKFSGIMLHIFERYFQDDYLMMFYRLITIEQYQDEKIRKIHDDFFFWNPISAQEEIFSSMMKRGLMRKEEPRTAAVQFFAPVCLLFDQSIGKTKDQQREAMEQVEAHVQQFYKWYLMEG